ncbi:hypothetical protein ACHZ97_04155 [Lysobacter soli]|uniref:hypothetical protein n=1 Tax=Lysobacter soli TaxID=453783 RepID=UPI0037CB7014
MKTMRPIGFRFDTLRGYTAMGGVGDVVAVFFQAKVPRERRGGLTEDVGTPQANKFGNASRLPVLNPLDSSPFRVKSEQTGYVGRAAEAID